MEQDIHFSINNSFYRKGWRRYRKSVRNRKPVMKEK